MRIFALLLLSALPVVVYPQSPPYAISALPEILAEGASATVLQDNMEIDITDIDKMEVRVERVVTVFNKTGDKAVRNYAFYDGITNLKALGAEIYDENGKAIEKIKKKDFKDVTAVDGFTLYTDSRVKYFEYTPLNYPYTIAFNYTFVTGNTAFIPSWTPVDQYGVSVGHSSYSLNYPAGLELRIKEKNLGKYPVTKNAAGNHISYELQNAPAIPQESLSPGFFTVGPRLLLALDKFHLEGVDGYGTDWKSFGKWQYDNLIQRRDELPPETITKIGNMVKGIDNPLEKTKRIYRYVQENTRYVSVQLGIGGWMPISASEVDRVKYGDCKGLANYTKALLKSQGIASYYTVVWAGNSKRCMEPDFASMQGNHVILDVPLEGRDLWLECTSQKIPFGFLGDFTDDRDVLVLMPEGGQIKHTASYLDDSNQRKTNALCTLSEDGSLLAEVEILSTGIEYDKRWPFITLTQTKKEEYYKEYWQSLNGLTIRDMVYDNNKDAVAFREKVHVEVPSYANRIGDDLLFRINTFDVNDDIPQRYRDRKHPFLIERGFAYEAVFEIRLPENYELNSLPRDVVLNTDYGEYSMKVEKNEEGNLLYKRKLLIRKGEYPSRDYEAYREFRRAIARNDNRKIVISK